MDILKVIPTLAKKLSSRKTAASVGSGTYLLAQGHIWPAVVVFAVGIVAEAYVDVKRG